MSEEQPTEVREEPISMTLAEFLESAPPGNTNSISDLSEVARDSLRSNIGRKFSAPEIQLYCGNDLCNGMRFFRRKGFEPILIPEASWHFFYITYFCSNCRKTSKTFSLAAFRQGDENGGDCFKFGEAPAYGPPTSARLIKLIGPERETFLKGRRCENQGLGIGAFVYYRRVIESQKNRILDRIIEVAQKLDAPASAVEELETAKAELQFSKALGSVKTSIPQGLLINGHNPLRLLHSALSEGLHDRTDEECLELATSVRVVLAELSERMAQALKDEVELNRAISHLLEP